MSFRTPGRCHSPGHRPASGRSQGARAWLPRLTVARNIALPHGRRLARAGFLPQRCEERLAEPIVNDLRVKATPTQAVRLLSGGNQQKVVLGKWLAGDARVFIFDEPTRGVDVGAKVEIYNLMNRLTESGAGIIMISSELPELLGMSDRILRDARRAHPRRVRRHRRDAGDAAQRGAGIDRRPVLSDRVGASERGDAESKDEGASLRHRHRPADPVRGVVGADAAFPHRLESPQHRPADQHQRHRRGRHDVRDHFRRHRSVGRDRSSRCRASCSAALLQGGQPLVDRDSGGARRRHRLRSAQRRAGQLRRPAAVHRDARHDERGSRRRAAVHRRTAGLRLRRGLPVAGHRESPVSSPHRWS